MHEFNSNHHESDKKTYHHGNTFSVKQQTLTCTNHSTVKTTSTHVTPTLTQSQTFFFGLFGFPYTQLLHARVVTFTKTDYMEHFSWSPRGKPRWLMGDVVRHNSMMCKNLSTIKATWRFKAEPGAPLYGLMVFYFIFFKWPSPAWAERWFGGKRKPAARWSTGGLTSQGGQSKRGQGAREAFSYLSNNLWERHNSCFIRTTTQTRHSKHAAGWRRRQAWGAEWLRQADITKRAQMMTEQSSKH